MLDKNGIINSIKADFGSIEREIIYKKPENKKAMVFLLKGIWAPFLLANSFINCKRTEIVEDKIQITKYNQKRSKKGKLPYFRFNKILIDPMREILRTEGGSEKTGLKRALHICRGHFVTYTQEAPLFGRMTGTFWKPMHLRGNKKEGVVVKEYQIKAPN